MTNYIARLYEWFGLIPFYSKDLGEFLRGLDYACQGYFAMPWYFYTALLLVVNTLLVFALQNDLVSIDRFKKQDHWLLAALIGVGFNFAVGFTVPFVAWLTHKYCAQLNISLADCAGFALSSGLWSFILFSLLTAVYSFVMRAAGKRA